MKKFLVLLLVMSILSYSSAYAEKSTEFNFPEFSVHVLDNYLTLTKESVKEVDGSNTLFDDLGVFIDYFELDPTVFLDAVNYQTLNEICIRCVENPEGIDLRILNNLDDSALNVVIDELKELFSQDGFDLQVAAAYRHPQTVFAVIEGYQSEDQGYTILYFTIAKINNKFYTISIAGICSTREKNEDFANDLLHTVTTFKIAGYPNFEIPQQSNSSDRYHSEFQLFDGEYFGEIFEKVSQFESEICDIEGSVYEPPAWSRGMMPYLTYSKSLTYNNITYLDIEYSCKNFFFDEDDALYSAFYEFRSGYGLEMTGGDGINNFAFDYNSVEIYLRDLYGNPHYQYKNKTKAEIDGHGMNEASFLLDGLDNEQLYDYSEWIIEDPAGSIKIEHIMYFTGYIYKHNVSVEIIR